jgi:hypothetical protein
MFNLEAQKKRQKNLKIPVAVKRQFEQAGNE